MSEQSSLKLHAATAFFHVAKTASQKWRAWGVRPPSHRSSSYLSTPLCVCTLSCTVRAERPLRLGSRCSSWRRKALFSMADRSWASANNKFQNLLWYFLSQELGVLVLARRSERHLIKFVVLYFAALRTSTAHNTSFADSSHRTRWRSKSKYSCDSLTRSAPLLHVFCCESSLWLTTKATGSIIQ